VGDAAKAAVVASLARRSDVPMLIVLPKSARVGDLHEELGYWLGPEHARRLRLFPQRDILPYERASDDPWDMRTRLETLAWLAAGGNASMPWRSGRGTAPSHPIIIASIEAVAQRTLSPEAARSAMSRLSVGDRVEPDDLLRRLQSTGYEVVPLVEAPGQTARRGGIVDVFPPQAEAPVRIEFFGPEVESLRLFDVDTQRSRDRVSSIDLGVASDVSPVAAEASSLLGTLDFGACDEETELRLREELAALANGGSVIGPSFLPALLSPYSLLDHLPPDATIVLDETADVSRALDEYVAETATMRIEREARGLLPIGLPPAQANWTDLQSRLETRRVVELARFATAEPALASDESRQPPFSGGLEEPPKFKADSDVSRPPFSPAPAFGGRVRILARDLTESMRRHEAVVIVSQQASRLLTLLGDEGLPVRMIEESAEAPRPGLIQLLKGSLPHGWLLRAGPATPAAEAPGLEFGAPQAEPRGIDSSDLAGRPSMPGGSARGTGPPTLLLLTDAEVFGFVKQRRAMRQPGADRSGLIADLTPGDYVVHLEHGIARFAGMVLRDVEGTEREFLELTYAQGDRLFVPVDQADRVARYVGPGDYHPDLTRLGSGDWARTRERVRRAVADVAHDLLDLYASRQLLEGHAFSPDTPWQQELEASFPYVETPDQVAAIGEVKTDMEQPGPMDRLICGDVGFGKTEVAVRAAFKAVMDGYQVAILVPTTVLAQQHFNTFKERLASLPARVEMLSRFLNDREQRQVITDTAEGTVDILIGTHRILQKDVSFKKLGLVVIDEEQRFGVAHKERLKQMRKEVDVLTLSATPIPRTLHMSLVGIRDLSNMMTPPEDRTPIRTYVLESDDQIIREAITRELERGGQIFFVHNRVYNIELIAARIRKLVPDAEVGIGHGQMHEDQLERTMLAFAHGEIDVLVCTTIIESGLDIPNANTIIINQADRLGLAQLYQLRGRVGRGAVRAYAYLLYDRGRALSEVAQRRLQAVFEATELGAGMQIALRDLEIRGAGNLLGSEQSGHMAAVGFDLYVRLLGEAVERLKALQRGETPPPPLSSRPAVTLDLPLTAYLPDGYIPDLNLRLAVYQRLSQARDDAEAGAIEQELRDRFGQLPPAARNLLWVVRLRLMATAAGVGAMQTENEALVIRMLPGRALDRAALARRLPAHSTVLSHQVRLDRDTLGEGWREALVRALDAIASASVVAA
jgi:transcription-repair coupling factor (superfamily II helicase)